MSKKQGVKGRFSARKKVEAAWRLLRGEISRTVRPAFSSFCESLERFDHFPHVVLSFGLDKRQPSNGTAMARNPHLLAARNTRQQLRQRRFGLINADLHGRPSIWFADVQTNR